MIHKIKALHDQGNGLSIRAISRELGLSRNTVRKYLNQDEHTIAQAQNDPSRTKRLDPYRAFLIHQLKAYPRLSAVKLARRLRDKVGELPASERSLRRYVSALKQQVASGQHRYYEPVTDNLPGVQCQVDPGELRGVVIDGEPRTVYFVVFVLACSRLMYVAARLKPLDTEAFIQLHDQAFRYFGGVTEECVYDQTKLVVVSEQYRELTLNNRFHHYATTAGYRIHACEGYDPESKGKVEAGVKYVKDNALYGETFDSESHLHQYLQHWLESVANVRDHATTGVSPQTLFQQHERDALRPYAVGPSVLHTTPDQGQTRRADKTGLISWKANKYSVPLAWQRSQVRVCEQDQRLLIHDCETAELIASHTLSLEKGRTLKNRHHYRDPALRIEKLESAVCQQLPDGVGQALCRLLKKTSPKIYKDQLAGVRDLLQRYTPVDDGLIHDLTERSHLTATGLQQYLQAWQQAKHRGRDGDTTDIATEDDRIPSQALQAYGQLGHLSGQEVFHEST